MLVVRHQLSRDLAAIELERHLEPAFDRVLHAHQHVSGVLAAEADQQRVLVVLGIGRDFLVADGVAITGVIAGLQLLVFAPGSIHGVDGEAHVVGVLSPFPAEVDAANRGGRCVAQLQQRFLIQQQLGLVDLHLAIHPGEGIGGEQVVPEPLAFLVVGGDAVSPLGHHLLDLVELRDPNGEAIGLELQGLLAMAAEFQLSVFAEMGVTAMAANQGILSGEIGCTSCGFGVLQAKQGTLHSVGVALVIDQRVGAEFTDADKARPGDVHPAIHLLTAARHVGHQGQAREVVARHKALARQVAVGAEVAAAVVAIAARQQQLLLAPGGTHA